MRYETPDITMATAVTVPEQIVDTMSLFRRLENDVGIEDEIEASH